MAEYIEKSTVLAIIGKHWRSKMYADDAIQAALDEIGSHGTSADVRPIRHGRWQESYMDDYLVCSECVHYWIYKGDQYNYRYCPNCGAKMDGV